MVLHNSKWDRKATRKYQIKHGISTTKPVEVSVDGKGDGDEAVVSAAPVTAPKGTGLFPKLGEEDVASDDEEEGDGFVPRRRRGDLGSNAWRYKDLDPSLDDDSTHCEIDLSTVREFKAEAKGPKHFNKIKTADLKGFVIGESLPVAAESVDGKAEGHIRAFSEAEKTAFLEMQERAERNKIHTDIQRKFGAGLTDTPGRRNVKTLDIGASGHNLAEVFENRLLHARANERVDPRALTSDLEYLLGSTLSLHDEPDASPSFSIPEAGATTLQMSPSVTTPQFQTTRPMPSTPLSRKRDDDAFLDEILG